MISISKTNSKLGTIYSINLPPVVTCRADAPCVKECYARKGNFVFRNVKQSHQNNLDEYKNNPRMYFTQVISNTFNLRFFRWHASGDIVDAPYFAGMVDVANACKDTAYLCFTKKYEIVNEYINKNGALPENLRVIFSAWGDWLPDNPYNIPVAYVFDKNKDNSNIPEDAFPCGGKCYECLACWRLRNGQSVYFKKH